MNDPSLSVVAICGSLRKGSYNRMVMNALQGLAPSGMQIAEAPPYRDFPLYDRDHQDASGLPAAVQALADAISAADGLIIVTPEYNFGIPGPLKNAIDWLSRLANQPFYAKPVALQSVSPGPLGGARVQYDLRRSLVFLDALTLNKPEIFIGNCRQKLDEQTGQLTDDSTRDFISKQLAAFARFIVAHGGRHWLRQPWGNFGRIARIECDGIDANAEQVRSGMAWVFDKYVTGRSLYEVQDEAKTAKRGLWADSHLVPPWEWRQTQREQR